MANVIKPKRSYTASNTPSLASGELAIQAADKKVLIGNSTGTGSILVASLNLSDMVGTTDNITQGSTNKYYADSLARASISSSATGLTYTSGTGVFSFTAGYSIPTTSSQTNWDSAYSERRQWDGGSTNLVAATGRTSLGLVIGTNVQAWDADLDAIAALAGTSGLLKKTAANTWSLDTTAYGSGTVTSVAALTLGTTGTDLSSSVATGTTTPVITLNVPSASATNRGALTSTDWSNFNTAYTNRITSLTTTGSSGSASLTSNTLNIPTYTLSGLGGQASSTNLTSLSGLSYASASFVKMTAAGTFSLDTSTYLTANQSITLSGDVTGSGTTAITTTLATVSIAKGGTGQTTKTAAYNALTPMTTLGDVEYYDGTNAVRLAGSTSSTKAFLSQTGTGTVSAAPAWSAVSKSDVGLGSVENTALSTWAGSSNITTTGTIATGTWNATAIGLSKGGTNANITATNGGVIYSTASALAVTAAGTSGQLLQSNGAAAPTWVSTLTGVTITGLKETKTAPAISTGTLTLDCSVGNVFAVSLNANITTLSFTNVPSTGTAFGLTLMLTADGTARTITWGSAVKWSGGTAPTLTSTNAKVDVFVLVTHDGGTNWYAFTSGQNL